MGDVCYRLQRVPTCIWHWPGRLFGQQVARALFSKRWARGVCGEAWCQPPDGLPAQAVLHG